MASFNKVILVGNLTRDPESRKVASGEVCSLSLAVNRTWYDKAAGQKREEVTYVDVTAWGKLAEVAGSYLRKGSPVMIEGRLQLETWDDKKTGEKRSKLKVVAEVLQLLGGRSEQRQEAPQQQQLPAYGSPQPDDECPF